MERVTKLSLVSLAACMNLPYLEGREIIEKRKFFRSCLQEWVPQTSGCHPSTITWSLSFNLSGPYTWYWFTLIGVERVAETTHTGFCPKMPIFLAQLWFNGASLIVQLVKDLPAMQETLSWIPGSGRSTGEGIGYPLQYWWASLVAQLVKNPPAMWETWVWSLGWEEPLEKRKATLSGILAWRILWTV